MPKRKQRTVEYYEAKIRKLQQKSDRRRQISDASFSDTEINEDVGAHRGVTYETISMVEPHPMVPELDLEPGPEIIVESELVPEPDGLPTPQEVNSQPHEPSVEIPQPELDPELLLALGDATEDAPVFGDNIHSSLSQRWTPILKKGLLKEIRTKLINEYPVPDNCRLLKAPTLNPEISAAVVEVVRNRDKSILCKQDQLGHGIAAISKAISLLLLGDDKVKAIKILSDGCRLLTDLHYTETQLRTKLITPCLQKSILCVIENQDRDETLFGVNLPDKIKSSKAIEKQGHQLKRVPNKPSTSMVVQSIPRSRYQENWQSPPRYPSASKGGRGGLHRTPAAQYRRPAPTTAQSRFPINQNKQRAPRQ